MDIFVIVLIVVIAIAFLWLCVGYFMAFAKHESYNFMDDVGEFENDVYHNDLMLACIIEEIMQLSGPYNKVDRGEVLEILYKELSK